MPVYEYLCKICETRFEQRKGMSEASDPVDCPAGHPGATRLLSVFASVGRAGSGGFAASPAAPSGGCGAGCACAHGG